MIPIPPTWQLIAELVEVTERLEQETTRKSIKEECRTRLEYLRSIDMADCNREAYAILQKTKRRDEKT